jgi:hypothetical protein
MRAVSFAFHSCLLILPSLLVTVEDLGNSPTRLDPFSFLLPAETTPWKEAHRADPRYDLLVVFSDVGGAIGQCFWKKITVVIENRKARDRSLCWECELLGCSGSRNCGFVIRRGEWKPDSRARNDIKRAVTLGIRLNTNYGIDRGDVWLCNNPWTGARVTGPIPLGP